MIDEVTVSTSKRTEFIDITERIEKIVRKSNIKEGTCQIFIPHTTAAITINENADPNVQADMLNEINKVIPFNDRYMHTEGNAAAHIKSSLIGVAESIIIKNSQLLLGTWQGIYFCEFDGPRRRKVIVRITS